MIAEKKNKKNRSDYSLLLIGNPNVGKSVIFGKLTGSYATVSNYPGTTVDIMTGYMSVGSHHSIKVTDTPGFYNMVTVTEEERVTKNVVLNNKVDIILHVADAKNIGRMLPLTLQLMEAGLPVILVLNMYDELVRAGLSIQVSHLEHDLGIPVVVTTASEGYGIENLKARILAVAEKRYNVNEHSVRYPENVEKLCKTVSTAIKETYNISKRALALMLLQKDDDAIALIKNENEFENIQKILTDINADELRISIGSARFKMTEVILEENMILPTETNMQKAGSILDKFTMHPLGAFIGVLLILYFGFYKFVGGFGAGFLVDFIESKIFEGIVNPKVDQFFGWIFGNSVFFNLFAGEYGVITLGLRYALAIVLPIVFTFFLVFSILEDSGYLPRLSMTLNNSLKKIGLSGRALIPLVLGLGCGTMATVVTRTLETSRERLIVIFLLSLAVPCAAQMGVIIGLLGNNGTALFVWFFTIFLIFVLAGKLLSRYVKGSEPTFFMELPPLRIPKISNILSKTFNRMKWYALEVIPIFMWASVIIWVGKITRIFDALSTALSYPAKWAGLPFETGQVFLYGFFRRDFGAAGLYDIQSSLSIRQIVVATVILTLFIPCIAQFSVIIKERGLKTAIFIFATVVPFAFVAGAILNQILILIGFGA